MDSKHQTVYLKDYAKPDYRIEEVSLVFDIGPEEVCVSSVLKIKKNPESLNQKADLNLDGESLELLSLELDGKALSAGQYQIAARGLTIFSPPDKFELRLRNKVNPAKNLSLLGLYKSQDIFVTQNESQGFRRITYYLDRPDVMAVFTTKIIADKKACPVLLSNGNRIESGDLENGRHFVTWHDPFPKPCYLFALVAGNLAEVKGEYTTLSGKHVDLGIYVEKGNEDRCAFAMESLKHAMRWDEETFGLECDLNHYKIVAVNDFNSGAMENKGLNIFNSQYVLAKPETATDQNFMDIEGVIGHEYFHNWTGNRVTCRDWFQLTLKEGLTIFRDQEFSSDLTSRPVKRIQDVRVLRDYQFAEDAGPNRHPIRPESYIEINNFYTVTVYEKGSEVIRMIQTLIGRENFRKGMTKYFELYDGQAVTTEDFVRSMELASGFDLSRLKAWYHQAGTPVLKMKGEYREASREFELSVELLPPKQSEGKEWKPVLLPLKLGLLDSQGKDMPLSLKTDEHLLREDVLWVAEPFRRFVFKEVYEKPVPSLLRNFSAPVHADYPYAESELIFLARHDTDDFNRFEAVQQFSLKVLSELFAAMHKKSSLPDLTRLIQVLETLLDQSDADPLFASEILRLPSMSRLGEVLDSCDFDTLFAAREYLLTEFARACREKLLRRYENLSKNEKYDLSQKAIGRRSLKNLILNYLLYNSGSDYARLAFSQFKSANNMTDQLGALGALSQVACEERTAALGQFYEQWKKDKVVLNKWFAVQASSKLETVLEDIRRVEKIVEFNPKNPNNIRALYGVFTQNLVRFHAVSGAGYEMIADKIMEVDSFNPSAAAHLAEGFKKFSKLDDGRKAKMRVQLEKILRAENLSRNTYEIVAKTLNV